MINLGYAIVDHEGNALVTGSWSNQTRKLYKTEGSAKTALSHLENEKSSTYKVVPVYAFIRDIKSDLEVSGKDILNLPMVGEWRGQSIRDYLCDLLDTIWDEGEAFSGKRPFGNSGWEHDLYAALAAKGYIDAEKLDSDDEFNYNDDSISKANKLIFKAIEEMRHEHKI